MQIIDMLIDEKADLSAKDANKRTPLHYAARNGRVEAVRHLMDVAYDQAIKAAEDADKKVNETNNGRRVIGDKKKRRRTVERYRAADDDSDFDDDDENLKTIMYSYLDEAIWYGQR